MKKIIAFSILISGTVLGFASQGSMTITNNSDNEISAVAKGDRYNITFLPATAKSGDKITLIDINQRGGWPSGYLTLTDSKGNTCLVEYCFGCGDFLFGRTHSHVKFGHCKIQGSKNINQRLTFIASN